MRQWPATIITLTVLLLGVPVLALAQTPTQLSVSPDSVEGGKPSTGRVTLGSSAPSGGRVVQLSSSHPAAATVPASVTVAAGATTASFALHTVPVAQNTFVTITASAGGGNKTGQLTVNP